MIDRLTKKFFWKQKEKQVNAWYLEYQKLWEQRANLGYEILEQPIQAGYVRELFLREDILNRKDAADYKLILKHIQNSVFSRDKKFKNMCLCKNCPNNFFKKRKKKYTCVQKPVSLEQKQFEKIPEKLKKHFTQYHKSTVDIWGRVVTRKRYKFNYPFYFVPRVKKHYVTKIKIFDPEIESKIDILSHKLFTDMDNWKLLANVRGWERYSDFWYSELTQARQEREWARVVKDEIENANNF